MTWPVVLLAAAWVGLVFARGVERRPAERVMATTRQPRTTPRADDRGPPASRPSRLASAAGRRRLTVITAAVAVVALVLTGPFGAASAAISVPVLARVKARRAARGREAARRARLPDAIDLLVVAGAAGLAPRQAVALVAERGPPNLRPAFAEVVARAGAGESWACAVTRLTSTVGEPARPVVHAVVAATEDGAPMATVLTRLADDARRQRRHDMEAAVRRLPVHLSFPLVCCSLPAFVLLTVVPLVAAGLQRLGPVAL